MPGRCGRERRRCRRFRSATDDFGEGRAAVGEDVGHRAFDGVEIDAEARGQVRLGIHVDAEDAIALLSERAGEVDRRRRLADAALLIGDRDHVGHRGITSNYRPARWAVRGRAGTSGHATPASRIADTPVIHTRRELFTISVDNWDRMMATVLAQRHAVLQRRIRPLSTNERAIGAARRDARGVAARAAARTASISSTNAEN